MDTLRVVLEALDPPLVAVVLQRALWVPVNLFPINLPPVPPTLQLIQQLILLHPELEKSMNPLHSEPFVICRSLGGECWLEEAILDASDEFFLPDLKQCYRVFHITVVAQIDSLKPADSCVVWRRAPAPAYCKQRHDEAGYPMFHFHVQRFK